MERKRWHRQPLLCGGSTLYAHAKTEYNALQMFTAYANDTSVTHMKKLLKSSYGSSTGDVHRLGGRLECTISLLYRDGSKTVYLTYIFKIKHKITVLKLEHNVTDNSGAIVRKRNYLGFQRRA